MKTTLSYSKAAVLGYGGGKDRAVRSEPTVGPARGVKPVRKSNRPNINGAAILLLSTCKHERDPAMEE